jgi:hypothetical protein
MYYVCILILIKQKMNSKTKNPAKTTIEEVTPEDAQAAFSNHAPNAEVVSRPSTFYKFSSRHFVVRANLEEGYVQVLGMTEAAAEFLRENQDAMLNQRGFTIADMPNAEIDAIASEAFLRKFNAHKVKRAHGLSKYEYEMSKLSEGETENVFKNLRNWVKEIAVDL